MGQYLIDGAKKFGIALTEDMEEQFRQYCKLLLEWNEKINLTAIVDEREIDEKHFLDSLSLAQTQKLIQNASIIDVGTGAGFPSLPLKIARPDLKVTLLDSLNKRIQFLQTVVDELHLNNVECIHMRAEEAGNNPNMREQFDIATARAVANLATLCEYCMPLIKIGGYFLAMKGSAAMEELEDAQKAISLLGGVVEQVLPVQLGGDYAHHIIVIRKTGPTPKRFPRKAGKPSKEPIR